MLNEKCEVCEQPANSGIKWDSPKLNADFGQKVFYFCSGNCLSTWEETVTKEKQIFEGHFFVSGWVEAGPAITQLKGGWDPKAFNKFNSPNSEDLVEEIIPILIPGKKYRITIEEI